MSNKLLTKPIKDLLTYNFLVDEYQRGYKWTAQQVIDLLNDINQFNKQEEAFYCLQPLAVKELDQTKKQQHFNGVDSKSCYEVIDGQQRLTTVYLILKYLSKSHHTIQYQTRKKSAEFLRKIDSLKNYNAVYRGNVKELGGFIMEEWKKYAKEEPEFNNIDNYHFFSAYLSIKAWFMHMSNEGDNVKNNFHNNLIKHTKFIWFQDASNDDSKVVFRNLNSGKIGLTNAELIKALFINSQTHPNKEIQELHQNTFASEWDDIEQTLQNNDFWFFINNSTDDNKYQTRIDFLFEIIVKTPKNNTDKLYTYRYYDNNPILLNWELVKQHYLKLKEWYNNNQWYHLIGYIIDRKINTVTDLIALSGVGNSNSSLSKDKFTEELERIIKLQFNDEVKGDDNKVTFKIKDVYNLDAINYEENYSQIVDVLLLFNICQYQKQISGIRFPFKSFKNTKWTLEHIHAQNTDEISTHEELTALIKDIQEIVRERDNEEVGKYIIEQLEVLKKLQKEYKDKKLLVLKQKEKLSQLKEDVVEFFQMHKLSNMALLDGPTNSGLGKKPFPEKRDYIIDKNNDTNVDAPFIPITTVNVFLKYYTAEVKQYDYWGYQDRCDYQQAIKNTLKSYIKA